MSICPFVRPYGTTRLPLKGFSWNMILVYFSKICQWKFNFHWNLKRITDTLHEVEYTFLISRSVLLKMFRTKVVEKIKTHVLCSIIFFSPRKSCRLWEMWKNIVQPGRPQITIWRTRLHAGYLSPKTHTQDIQYLFAFQLQQWLHERASMLRYTYIACLVGSLYYRRMAYFGRNML